MTKVLFNAADWDAGPWITHFRDADPSLVISTSTAPADLAGIRYAIVWRPEPGLLARCRDLEVIFNLGAGVDAILADKTIPPELPIVRIVDPNMTERMSEWVVLQALVHHRRMLRYMEQQKERRWHDIPAQPAASAIAVGVMGLGALGSDAARKLQTMGFKVAGWSRTPKSIPGIETFSGADGIDRFLARTEMLVSLLPMTPETRGLIDAKLIAKLKRDGALGGAVVINAGRGGSQVTSDILAALNSGQLIGASLDVFETEPLEPSHPIWAHPNVVITPHNAADSEPAALARYISGQIQRRRDGKPLQNVVERTRGY
ncbi:MAG: glyoxylate/hydroxypyruvate reductase A [Hyphomicrobiaceae bacterium]